MKFKMVLTKFDSPLWGHHIMIPEEVVQSFLGKKDRRVICNINDAVEFHCALMSKGNGQYFININKELRKKLELQIGSEMEIELREDHSKYGMPMPEEMEAVLELDDEGDKYFHALTPGKQRSLLYIISKSKSTNKRMEKAVVIIDYLKATCGKIDWQELQQAFREVNS